jgi:integron integrase
MQQLSPEIEAAFEQRLNQAQVPTAHRPGYHKWLHFYLLFCEKFQYSPRTPTSLGPFLNKLAARNQPIEQRRLAAAAVRLFLRPSPQPSPCANNPDNLKRSIAQPAVPALSLTPPPPGRGSSWEQEYRDLESAIKLRNYSTKTLDAYRLWISKFQAFVRSRPSAELGTAEVRAFLSSLAVQRHVAASTQNQAFNSLLFFFRHVLGREFGKLDGVVRPKRHRYIPVVLSRAEVDAVLAHLQPPYRLVVLLLYGCGLRLAEGVNLRIHCFNLDSMLLTVHDGKGQKDRTVPLPARALPEIRQQIENVRRLHTQDLREGYAGVFLPRQLERKYKNAAREFIWQWFFPAVNLTFVPQSRELRRYHLHESHVQGAVKEAATRAGILKRVSPHTFRHTFASHLLLADYDLQTIQRLLGHTDIKTTMIYLQTVPTLTLKEAKSPLDCL